jgi:hypothetical protein
VNNYLFAATGLLLLIPVAAYAFDKKLFYYCLLVIYPIVGQSISTAVTVFGVSLNPSMIFGMLVLILTALDFVILPSRDRALDVLAIVFIGYSLMISAFSPTRFDSLSWTLKLATWMLMFLVAIRLFREEKDLAHIHLAVGVAVTIVLFSFVLSRLGFYGESFTYETGVESYGGGYSAGKILAYYLAMALPILAVKTDQKQTAGRAVSIVLMGLSLVAVLMTFVRSPVVSLVLGFLAYQFFRFQYGHKRLIKFLGVCSAVAVLIAGAALMMGKTHYLSRWGELGDRYQEGQVDKLASGRVGGLMRFYEYYFYKASLTRRIFGSGLGSSYALLGNQKIIHNDFAEILMGCGVIGFSMYVIFLARVFGLLLVTIKGPLPANLAFCGTLAMSAYFILLAFHMTNVTSGVFILSIWSVFTGAAIGNAKWAAETRRSEAPPGG